MKKLALSLAVIAASGVYILNRPPSTAGDLNSLAGASLPAAEGPLTLTPATASPATASPATADTQPAPAPSAPRPVPEALPPAPRAEPAPARNERLRIADLVPPAADPPAPAGPPVAAADKPKAPVPPPRPEGLAAAAPSNPSTSVSQNTVTRVAALGFRDGAYTGPVTNAYYGLMQVRATVRNGRLVAVDILRFPSDRRQSVFINRVALPILRDEVVQAQSARVDIVSGATLSSRAFLASLTHALQDARA